MTGLIAATLRVSRALSPTAWITLAVLAAFLLFGGYCARRAANDVRDDQALTQARAEARASGGRETAATERTLDTGPYRTANRREAMRLKAFLTACLMSVSCAAAVASCGTRGAIYPPAEDLRVQAKPIPPDDVLTSRMAGEKYDNAVEAWGEAGWLTVGRACRFWREQGMALPFECPSSPRQASPPAEIAHEPHA